MKPLVQTKTPSEHTNLVSRVVAPRSRNTPGHLRIRDGRVRLSTAQDAFDARSRPPRDPAVVVVYMTSVHRGRHHLQGLLCALQRGGTLPHASAPGAGHRRRPPGVRACRGGVGRHHPGATWRRGMDRAPRSAWLSLALSVAMPAGPTSSPHGSPATRATSRIPGLDARPPSSMVATTPHASRGNHARAEPLPAPTSRAR